MDELSEIYLEASGGKYGDEKGILAVRDHILKEHDRKYNELVALIWHKIGNGEDGATPIEKLISDFSDEHYRLFNTFRDREATIVDLTEKLDRAERASVPVKTRWNVTAGEAARMMQNIKCELASNSEMIYSSWDDLGENYKEDFTKTFEKLLPRLAAHAVIDAPAGVPSVEELVAAGDTAYNACSGPYQEGQEARATAIRDAVLAGVAAKTITLNGKTLTAEDFSESDGSATRLSGVDPPADQVEALARVLREAHAKHYGGVPETYLIDGFRAEARAAIAHLPTRPEVSTKPVDLWAVITSIVDVRVDCDGCDYVEVDRTSVSDLEVALRPWLRDPVGFELDVTADVIEVIARSSSRQTRAKEILDLCRARIRPIYECDCSAIEKERDLLKVEYESRQIMINNVRAALEGRPFKNTLEGE